MSTLDEWTLALCTELGLVLDDAATRTVLDLARVVAHQVDRPAAPVTAYILGAAVGGGRPLADSAARIQQLAENWQPGS